MSKFKGKAMVDINRMKKLAGILNESYQDVQFEPEINEIDADTRKMTNELHRMMDEGEIDPRAVADAALIYMSKDDVEEMMHANEMVPFDMGDPDVDDYDDDMSPEDNVRQVFDREPKLGA